MAFDTLRGKSRARFIKFYKYERPSIDRRTLFEFSYASATTLLI